MGSTLSEAHCWIDPAKTDQYLVRTSVVVNNQSTVLTFPLSFSLKDECLINVAGGEGKSLHEIITEVAAPVNPKFVQNVQTAKQPKMTSFFVKSAPKIDEIDITMGGDSGQKRSFAVALGSASAPPISHSNKRPLSHAVKSATMTQKVVEVIELD